MELIDILNENGIKTGQVASRDEAHRKGLWHRAIVVAIINEKNEILLQQRAANKEKMPICGIYQLLDIFHQDKTL